jgi:hypothetical protein
MCLSSKHTVSLCLVCIYGEELKSAQIANRIRRCIRYTYSNRIHCPTHTDKTVELIVVVQLNFDFVKATYDEHIKGHPRN